MVTKSVAEAIILQGMEDLWDLRFRAESLKFFAGKEFRTCARMAGMSTDDKLKLLHYVKQVVGNQKQMTLSQPKTGTDIFPALKAEKTDCAVNM